MAGQCEEKSGRRRYSHVIFDMDGLLIGIIYLHIALCFSLNIIKDVLNAK